MSELKKLPFVSTTSEHRDLCVLYGLANVFGDSDFLSTEICEGWKNQNGIMLNEANLILNLINGFAIEDAIRHQTKGVSFEDLNYIIEFDEGSKVYAYPAWVTKSEWGRKAHFVVVVTHRNKVYMIDSNQPDGEIVHMDAWEFEKYILLIGYKFLSIGCFVYERQPHIFDEAQMQHILC